MKSRHRIPAALGLWLALASAARAQGSPVLVDGVTYQATYIDFASGRAAYEPLDDVTVSVKQGRGSPDTSKDGGNFRILVEPGTPFNVLFEGQKRVPELEQLTGQEKLENKVHVTLLTREQYERLHGRGALIAKLVHVGREIRDWDSEAARRARETIRQIAREADINLDAFAVPD